MMPHGLAARTFSQTEALPGERVFTVGYPLGWGPAISYGYIGNPNTFLQTVQSRLLQVDLSACSGNSGGGLFNAHGEKSSALSTRSFKLKPPERNVDAAGLPLPCRDRWSTRS